MGVNNSNQNKSHLSDLRGTVTQQEETRWKGKKQATELKTSSFYEKKKKKELLQHKFIPHSTNKKLVHL